MPFSHLLVTFQSHSSWLNGNIYPVVVSPMYKNVYQVCKTSVIMCSNETVYLLAKSLYRPYNLRIDDFNWVSWYFCSNHLFVSSLARLINCSYVKHAQYKYKYIIYEELYILAQAFKWILLHKNKSANRET